MRLSDQLNEMRRPVSALRVAAWGPDADENQHRWDEVQRIAVQWIVEQAAIDGV
jgi:hypothetical protein